MVALDAAASCIDHACAPTRGFGREHARELDESRKCGYSLACSRNYSSGRYRMTTAAETQALPTGTWNGDPVHSDIGFSVEYMAGTFSGSFAKFQAELVDGALSGSADGTRIPGQAPKLQAP